jgi:hypothetical protein
MRDMVMERDIDNSYSRGPENHKLYVKLGGFKGALNFDLTARLPGGSDPYSWMTTGLKNTIIQHFVTADMQVYFEDNIPRQWYMLGSEYDINRIPDFTYQDFVGEAGQAEKYGFQLDGSAGFMDNKGRKIRVIGSAYKRHYQDKQGQRLPIRATCKSDSLEQPTQLYLPYSFRVYSGIMPESPKRTGLIIAARDCIRTMLCVQSRIALLGNNDNLYQNIAKNNTYNAGTTPNNPVYSVDATPKDE